MPEPSTIEEALSLAELPEATYAKVVQGLCSHHFFTHLVDGEYFYIVLDNAISIGTDMDAIKKALFYGKVSDSTQTPGLDALQCGISPHVVHAILGLFTESVELLERLKLMLAAPEQDHKLNLVEELGDLDWYAQLLRTHLGVTSGELRATNARKLFRRYPDRVFAATQALQRDLFAEQEALDGR